MEKVNTPTRADVLALLDECERLALRDTRDTRSTMEVIAAFAELRTALASEAEDAEIAELLALDDAEGIEPIPMDEHDAEILRDLEAMAGRPNNGFWPQALAIGALRIIRTLVADRKDAERYRWLRDLKCNSVTVGHDDENACNYMDAKKWIDGHMYPDEYDDVPPDELQRMKDTNSIWAVQIYPDTPIGFNKYYGATLDAAIDAAIAGTESNEQ